MTAFIVRRLIIGLIILVIVSMVVFLLMRLLPGDPLLAYIGESQLQSMTVEDVAKIRHEYGLDKPLFLQYYDWVSGLVHGDMGKSIVAQADITTLIQEKLPITLHISGLAFVIGTILGILFGVICALTRGRWIDYLLSLLANFGITVPGFWLGIIFIYVFALKLGWLPVSGYTSPFDNFWLSTRQIIMPVVCLAIVPVASLCRQMRSVMLEVIRQDYMRTARSKGLSERLIIWRHALKNALIPIVTLLGMQLAHILGGTIIMETIFNIPGMGRLMVNSVFSQDYQVVQAGVLLTGVMVLFMNLITDISYGWIDPRIRYR
jgi:peptide/nickel transport system permease protein